MYYFRPFGSEVIHSMRLLNGAVVKSDLPCWAARDLAYPASPAYEYWFLGGNRQITNSQQPCPLGPRFQPGQTRFTAPIFSSILPFRFGTTDTFCRLPGLDFPFRPPPQFCPTPPDRPGGPGQTARRSSRPSAKPSHTPSFKSTSRK